MDLKLVQSYPLMKRFIGATRGRPVAVLILLFILVLETLNSLPHKWTTSYPVWLTQTINTVRSPLMSSQLWLFDTYQKILPRSPASQPVTIVSIDEKSIASLGQWPWPRDSLARLINSINAYRPAAIGLDIYMPEPDQNSPDKLAKRLPPGHDELIDALMKLPSNDFKLAIALSSAPTILGAAGFDFSAYTTSDSMLTVPLVNHGADALPFLENYPQVLASLPALQQAALGQALLSISSKGSAVRRIPLLAAIGGKLVPSLAMEMLRVATGSDAIQVTASDNGINQVSVADLTINTQPQGDIWLHYARLSSGRHRYVSAIDVLNNEISSDMLESKLVLIGLTGSGLSDMKNTALNELVPGVEIQAQALESLFDGHHLKRPGWLSIFETILVLGVGLALIWFVPRQETRIGRLIKYHPQWMLGLIAFSAVLFFSIGLLYFYATGLLFAATSVIIGLSVIITIFSISASLENFLDARLKMARLVENGIAVGREREWHTLLKMTRDGLMDFAPCEAIVIFVKTKQGILVPVIQHGLQEVYIPHIDLSANDAKNSFIERVYQRADSMLLDEKEFHKLQDDDLLQQITTSSGLGVISLLTAPMLLANGAITGVVLLINAIDPLSKVVINFSKNMIPYVDALVTQTAVALENQDLVEAQKTMMDAMIKMIAEAIDAKSPYTGGHCKRVPELAIMLCEAANEINEGPLANFKLQSDDEWREFNIAAWLHDCGKVTTPEHVVDKSTKLETIYNRIHEVRTRFEVLLRDAQIEFLQAVYERGDDRESAEAHFAERKAKLKDDFEFIANCNQGGEFLEPEKIERIKQIAEQTLLRNFDNRIGLSEDELGRHKSGTSEKLPVVEHLLSDRPEHIIPRPPLKALDPKFGFKLDVPEHLYNHGELHNLEISRGTLTAEERFKINEHIIQTIAILEQMPFPENLSRVAEYAGTHHETLIGTGYPRKLTGDQISTPGKIMAIADIFEALTASDRPYKKAKTLSESIRILSFFKKDSHIDPVLFDLFLTSGIYQQYAENYLSPEQIDHVDISQYIG